MRDALPKIVTKTVPGPKSEAILKRRDMSVPKALCGTAYPLVIDKGEGAVFEDVDGNIFLDWIGGVGVLNVGYSDLRIVEAVQKQATRYFHTIFNIVAHEGYIELAEKLNEIMPCRGKEKKTYFANSGAECDERGGR